MGAENSLVALKVQKSADHYFEAAFDEIEILEKARKERNNIHWLHLKYVIEGKATNLKNNDCYVCQLTDYFVHMGVHGKHPVMVFELVSVNLLEIIKKTK